MTNPEIPLIKNVTHLESTFNFDNPTVKKYLLDWFQTSDSVPSINNNPNGHGRLGMLTDLWRQCPILREFESFYKNNKEPFSIIRQYQNKGEWFHTERRAEEISALANETHPFVLLIEKFAKKGNITAVTNLLYLFDKQRVDIPWHISYEALIWAELTQAKHIFEKEKPEFRVRLKSVEKQEKESEAKHDPFYHLYCAYLLLRELEAMR